jgi:Tfp pilus assembly protein PilF
MRRPDRMEFNTVKKVLRRVCRLLALSLVGGMLAGCNLLNQSMVTSTPGMSQATRDKIPTAQGKSGAEHHLAVGLSTLADGKADLAFSEFNRGLKFEPQHPHLHFLNALIYHQRALAGNSTQFELAEVGYRLALKFDSSHWLAAYQLGKLYMGQRQFGRARDEFSRALLVEPDNPSIAYGLAVASYSAGWPETAHVALQRLPDSYRKHPAVLRASALIEAALGRVDAGRRYLEEYRAGGAEAWRVRLVSRRLDSWASFHRSNPDQLAQNMGTPTDSMPGGPGAPVAPGADDAAPTEITRPAATARTANMVILDAVIISQETSTSSRTGVNLLSGLSLMFSGNIVDYARNRTQDNRTDSSSTNTTQINRSLTVALPAVTYSLNIANAQDSTNKLLARPSVLAYNGAPSEIFIGTEITYTTTGENSNSFTKEVGLTLKATPEFSSDGTLKVTVHTEFDSIAPTAAPGTFSQAVATVKSRSDVVAEVEFGQTLVIGAGSSKRSSKTEDGVPVLKDIPLIRNLFNVENESDQETSLLILITPRRPARLDAKTGRVKDLIVNPGGSEPESPELEALRKRYRDWWSPTSNVLNALHGLRGSDALKEFRRGDIRFLDLDENLSMEGSKESPGPRGIVRTLVENMYY